MAAAATSRTSNYVMTNRIQHPLPYSLPTTAPPALPSDRHLPGPVLATQGQTSEDYAPPEAESPQLGSEAWIMETISEFEVTLWFPPKSLLLVFK